MSKSDFKTLPELLFHGFLTGLMNFFEEFAQKSYSETSKQSYWIDIDKVITINGGFFDRRYVKTCTSNNNLVLYYSLPSYYGISKV